MNAKRSNAVASVVAFVAFVAFSWCMSAAALTRTNEITDMWWNPAESGWGVNVILQADTAFMTFFVYDTAQNPVWYTAQLTQEPGGAAWSGGLFATKGPWFGGAFPPASVTLRTAGSARFVLSALNAATLSYTVDGVSITKAVVRQTWRNEDLSGVYAGGYSVRTSNCNPASLNGINEVTGVLTITQAGSATTMVASLPQGTCTFTGTYVQVGKLGTSQGSYSCSTGEAGTFQMPELSPTASGFTGRVQGSNQACQWAGTIGGITRAQ